MEEENIIIEISKQEALVLLEWLINFNNEEHPQLFSDQAEQKVLWKIEGLLEKIIPEILELNYLESLAKARQIVRDDY